MERGLERERDCTCEGGTETCPRSEGPQAVLARASGRGPRERVRRWAVRKVKRWEVDISAYGQREEAEQGFHCLC